MKLFIRPSLTLAASTAFVLAWTSPLHAQRGIVQRPSITSATDANVTTDTVSPVNAYYSSLPSNPVFPAGTVDTTSDSTSTPDATTTPDTPPATQPTPEFYKTQPTLRKEDTYAVGGYLAIFGGGNLAQDGEMGTQGMYSDTLNLKNSQTGPVAGGKIGFTYAPGWFNTTPSTRLVSDSEFQLLPTIEAEYFYTQLEKLNFYKSDFAQTGSSATYTTSPSAHVVSLNFLLKAQVHCFRPYIGAGIGGASLETAKTSQQIPGLGVNIYGFDRIQGALALQAIAGSEIFLFQRFALYGEYKYLYLTANKFQDTSGGTYDLNFGQHLFVGGLKYYF